MLININALIWLLLIKFKWKGDFEVGEDSWTTLFSLTLSTTLSFLLVFKLNRVAIRFWDIRRMWGGLVEQTRVLASGILEHTNHDAEHRDRAISWLGAFVVATKQILRKEDTISFCPDELAGFLSQESISIMASSHHPGLYAALEIRHSLKIAFDVDESTPAGLGVSRSSVLRMLESSIEKIISHMGGLERIKSTPMPVIYVTHLRTMLLLYLLSLPYVYGNSWGWGTIPSVGVISYAFLGIEGAATECEKPFRYDRLNHLDMDNFCLQAIKNIEQLVIHSTNTHTKSHSFSMEGI